MGKLFIAIIVSLALFGVSVFGLVYCSSPKHNENSRYEGVVACDEESEYYDFTNFVASDERIIVDEWQISIGDKSFTADKLQTLMDNGDVVISRDTVVKITYSLSAPSDMEFNYTSFPRVAKKNYFIFAPYAVAECITFLAFLIFLWYFSGISQVDGKKANFIKPVLQEEMSVVGYNSRLMSNYPCQHSNL